MAVPTGPANSPGDNGVAVSSSVRLQILGPLRVWRGGVELDVGPRQQAYLLALLLAREGRPTSTTELLDLVWGEGAPTSAINVIHKYIGALRRLMEPTLPSRETGSHLLRHGNGYLFSAAPATLDLVTFRELVAAAETAVTQHREDEALDHYVRALGLWAGPAGAGLAQGPAAMTIFAALDGEFFDACVAAAELAVSRRRPERVLASLQLAATMAPLHEPLHAALINTLAACGRQAEALAAFGTVRARLAEDLGIDPDQTLQAAHRRVLSQSLAGEQVHGDLSTAKDLLQRETPTAGGLVGRVAELAAMRQMLDEAFAGSTGLVVVEGEPGAGKTTLLKGAADEAAARDALVVWGSCLEGDGTPSMWPWVQVITAVVAALPSAIQEKWLDTDLGRLVEPREGILAGSFLPDSGTQFRLFERVVAVLGEAASAQRPLVLVIDDLHWADPTSLELFDHVAARLPAGTIVVGALRDHAPAPGTELGRTLAAASRVPSHRRIRLGPLNPSEVAALVRRETGRDPGSDAALGIYARTGGNPFFVRELSRFLADSGGLSAGSAVPTGVPSTVRDVVRDRLADLEGSIKELLQIAALIGRDIGVDLLAQAAGLDVPACLDRLEPLKALGVLEPTPQDPFSFRFAHDLVRESVEGITLPRHAIELHLRIADALERISPEDESVAERLAHHLSCAGPLADPARTATALVRAGSCAATKSALEAAERHLRAAVQVSRKARHAELELSALSQLTAVVGMRSMYGASALDLLERAEHLARGLGRELEATGFLYSRWAAHAQGIELDRSGPLARRLLDQGYASEDPIVRAYGLQAWGIHQWDLGNIGEAFRYLSQSERTLLAHLARHDEDPVRRDLKLLMTGLLAEVTALHGDVAAAQVLLDALQSTAGDNPYRITIWATMAVRIAVMVGDPANALHAAERGIAVDPGFSFTFLGTYQRLARCWALVVSGEEPDATAAPIAEAQRLIAANLLDPPRSCVATWYALLAEMHLAAGSTAEAAVALDRADFYLNAYGQRYPEGLLLLMRARLLQAQGKPITVVHAAAAAARALSVDREARLFARRAEQFLTQLG
ncbi:BTAD domain-containing putative transcriptional regulator [Mycolicibacterium stellerae]|uniref:BTAD domain-containing putative transcriptional regulator n=1 Tax=Mycolicibacterium stellerae TaxID=2358193 RepID=UPI001F3D72BB|nr:BTAD domain-containing putative transcriptional regulator [Mycolicibacterium stellerae]